MQAQDDEDEIAFPSRMQKQGGWGSTSQKTYGTTWGSKQTAMNAADDEEIPFPSRVQKTQRGNNTFNRPATTMNHRNDDEDAIPWGSKTAARNDDTDNANWNEPGPGNKMAMNRLQS